MIDQIINGDLKSENKASFEFINDLLELDKNRETTMLLQPVNKRKLNSFELNAFGIVKSSLEGSTSLRIAYEKSIYHSIDYKKKR